LILLNKFWHEAAKMTFYTNQMTIENLKKIPPEGGIS